MKLLKIAALMMMTASPLAAHDYHVGAIEVDHPFSFVAPEGAMASGGFLSVTNTGETDDRLVAVEAPFDMVQLHNHIIDDQGVASMVHLEEGIAVPAGEMVMLAPGGLHVMFMGDTDLERAAGNVIPAVLVFEKAGRLEVEFMVKERDAEAMDHSTMDHSQMDHASMDHNAHHTHSETTKDQ